MLTWRGERKKLEVWEVQGLLLRDTYYTGERDESCELIERMRDERLENEN
jgi:hypothetical protein